MNVIYISFVLSLILSLSFAQQSSPLEKAKQFLSKNILIDGHNDLVLFTRKTFKNKINNIDLSDTTKYDLSATDGITHTDINRLRLGKVGGQFWALSLNCSTDGKDALLTHLEQADTLKRIFNKYPDVFKFATTAQEVRDAFKNGRIASLLALEGGHALDSSLAILRIYYQIGVRYFTLALNCDTPWCGAHRNETKGLTGFGEKIIKEMNRLGMMVDISHVSHKTMLDVLRVSKAPVIVSHSCVRKLCNITRNVPDDVLDKLKENNGVMMINFYSKFLTCNEKSTIDDVIEHINYVKNKIGTAYVGIGADYDGIEYVPQGLEDVSKYPNLFAELIKQGWSEEDLAKLAGGNILRVMEANEKYAKLHEKDEELDDVISKEEVQKAVNTNCRTFL